MKRVLYHLLQLLSSVLVVALWLNLGSGHFASPLMASPVSASGSTTTSDQAGQVTTVNEDGVLYLTTQTNEGVSTIAGTLRSRYPFIDMNIFAPRGYAKTIGGLISAVLTFIMVLSALAVLVYVIWGAFNWLTSGGDKGKIDQARQKIIAAVVGLIIVASAYAMVLVVINFVGFADFNDVFSSLRPIDSPAINGPPRPASPRPTPSPLLSPTPTATPQYNEDLGELL